MKKTIIFLVALILMSFSASADLNMNQTLITDGDIHQHIDMYAGGNIYTSANVTFINPTGQDRTVTVNGPSTMSALLRMVDIFESNPNDLTWSEDNFMSRFMKFMTYLFNYFHEERIRDLEFQVKALKAVQNTIDSDMMCKAEVKVAFDVYNMTQYKCENGIVYHSDNSGGYIVLS